MKNIGLDKVQNISIKDIFPDILLTKEEKNLKGEDILYQKLYKKRKKFFNGVSYYRLFNWPGRVNAPETDRFEGVIVVGGIKNPDAYEIVKELFPNRCVLIFEQKETRRMAEGSNCSPKTAKIRVDRLDYFRREATIPAVDPWEAIHLFIMPPLMNAMREK